METHLKTGRIGEEIAIRYLQDKGYILRERNWRIGRLEVDIIVQRGSELIFVEVKTRHVNPWGTAIDAVDTSKRNNIIRASKAYIKYYQLDLKLRYDIIGIDVYADGTYTITHSEHAYNTPYGRYNAPPPSPRGRGRQR